MFEMIRLVLPEHRGAMDQYQTARAIRKKPVLSQQEWEYMSFVISDAIESGSSVRLTLFGPFENEVWEGIPVIYAGQLHIVIDDERRRLPAERLIAVTTLN